MKECPFCKESIQHDAVICRYCHELIDSKRLEAIEKRKLAQESSKKTQKLNIGVVLLLFSTLIAILLFFNTSVFTRPGFPLLQLVISILCLALVIVNIIFIKTKIHKINISLVLIPFLIISSISFIRNMGNYSEYLEQKRAVEKRSDERLAKLKYDKEHSEELYLSGINSLKEKKYYDAKNFFDRINDANPNFKDVKIQLESTKQIISNIEIKERLAKGKKDLEQAKKYSKSNNCYELLQAINICEIIVQTIPELKSEASKYLLTSQLEQLSCYEGNSLISMAIQIEKYHPLTLWVSIKNNSTEIRHANPNYFTLVTVDNQSLSHSTETYGEYNYFNAVDLQPGTKTSGSIVFDTYEKPRRLIYKEFLGTEISRIFPFD